MSQLNEHLGKPEPLVILFGECKTASIPDLFEIETKPKIYTLSDYIKKRENSNTCTMSRLIFLSLIKTGLINLTLSSLEQVLKIAIDLNKFLHNFRQREGDECSIGHQDKRVATSQNVYEQVTAVEYEASLFKELITNAPETRR